MRLSVGKAFLLGSFCFGVFAIPNAQLKERYQPIVERNPFGLKPPPPAVVAPPVKTEEPPKKSDYFLTGISSVGYPRLPKKAFLMIREQGGKKDTNFLSLTEGQRLNDVEVLAINDKDYTVRIKTPDTGEMLLSFKTHGITNPIVPLMAPGGRPGMPGGPGVPGAIPPPPMNIPGQPGNPNMGGNFDGNQPGGGVGGQNAPSNLRTIPSRATRARGGDAAIPTPLPGGGNPGGLPSPAPSAGDPATDYLQRRLQEEAAAAAGISLPPTPPG